MTVVPHIWQAWGRWDLTEIVTVITPGMKTKMAPAILKTKILKDSKKGLLELYQPMSSTLGEDLEGGQITGYTHEPRWSSLRMPRPLPGEANSILNCQLPSAPQYHGLEAHL